jgi:hypothetical protein
MERELVDTIEEGFAEIIDSLRRLPSTSGDTLRGKPRRGLHSLPRLPSLPISVNPGVVYLPGSPRDEVDTELKAVVDDKYKYYSSIYPHFNNLENRLLSIISVTGGYKGVLKKLLNVYYSEDIAEKLFNSISPLFEGRRKGEEEEGWLHTWVVNHPGVLHNSLHNPSLELLIGSILAGNNSDIVYNMVVNKVNNMIKDGEIDESVGDKVLTLIKK